MLNNTAATIYNKVIDYDTEKVTYQRTVLPAVHWEDSFADSGKGKNRSDQRTAFVSIDFSVCNSMNKSFLPAHLFAQLPLSECGKYWTLAKDDLIIKGSVLDDITDIKRWMVTHPECASITTVETFDMGSPAMQHWEVYAK